MDQLENLSPETLEAMDLTQQAHLLATKEMYEDAYDLLAKAQEADPMYVGAYVEEGNIRTLEDELDLAEACYEKGLQVNKNDGALHYSIGNLKLLRGEFKDAIAEYRTAEELGYEDEHMTVNLGYCHEELGDADSAMVAYIRAGRQNPEWVDPVAHRINLLAVTGQMEEAESLCKTALERFPLELSVYALMIDILVEKDNYDEAEECLKVALEIFPDDKDLRLQKVRLYGLKGRYEEAHAEVAKLREEITDPESLDALDTIEANLYLGEEKPDQAIESCKARISRETDGMVDVEARNMLMELLSAQKRYTELLELTNDCLKKKNADDFFIRAIVLQPYALEQLGRTEEAMLLYKEGLTKLRMLAVSDSTRTEARVYRIMCLRGLKQYDKALEELDYCEKLAGTNDAIRTLRAQLLMDKGDKEAAKAIMDGLQEKARKTLGI
ncbi:MAG: tetratricopeptide repeat protein [Clostridia bacterium]|nr:tetratricopeptide repeat protein [Clostridia bacterium]